MSKCSRLSSVCIPFIFTVLSSTDERQAKNGLGMGGDNTIIFILPEPVFETGQASSTKLKSTKKVSLTKSLHKVAHFNLAWVKPFDLLSTVK